MNRSLAVVFSGLLALGLHEVARGADADEFKVKRQEVFGFTQRPTVTREGDKVTIAFEPQGYCDVTVAIEAARAQSGAGGHGRIIRHLACGVLGSNAPAPFVKSTLKQAIVWDSKNDQGEYIDNKDGMAVRVSLGLKPSFERNLLLEPKRRHGSAAPLFQVAPEGVYVYDGGNGFDYVRLFDHEGKYVRTVYPFPADKIGQVTGLNRVAYPQDGETLPVKSTFLQQTFLTCGNLYGYPYPAKYAIGAQQADGDCHYGMYGYASSILAVNGGRLALGKTYLCRLASDGTSGGLPIEGPAICLTTKGKAWDTRGQKIGVAPRCAALSPDGRTLYLAGYNVGHFSHASADIVGGGEWEALNCVQKMDIASDIPPTLFAGHVEEGKSGADNGSFNVPASIAVDKSGRVYVADFANDRVQVFAPDGAFLKSIAVTRPAIVSIDGKTQEIYVFSSLVYNAAAFVTRAKVEPELTVFGPFDAPQKKLSCKLPEGFGTREPGFWYWGTGSPLSAVVDGYATPPRIWMANEWMRETVMTRGRIGTRNIEIFSLEGGALKSQDNFGKDVEVSAKRAEVPRYGRARLYVNPKNGRVYVGEGEAFDYKSFKTMLELDPETGSINPFPIPFDAEDMCFDVNGLAYLRSISVVGRFDPVTWREIPWDYGEERPAVFTSSSSDRKEAKIVSGLALPANGGWHHGGMFVSLKGNLAVACGVNLEPPAQKFETGKVEQAGKPYSPKMYPGRTVAGRGGAPLIHIWDRRGRTVAEDCIPGIGGNTYGIGLDASDALYVMSSATRVLDGTRYLNKLSGTLLKAIPGKPKMLSKGAVLPLVDAEAPKRPVDLEGAGQGSTWAEGVEWMYGGVGYDGKNAGVGCGCWNARAAFDYFARSFAPELDRYRVAVLDSNGNLILRIGKYGNVDSSGPKSAVPLGGDEVGMVHGAYLATDTDRRLFVADPSNDRIFSVKLDYHAEETVLLKDIAEQGKK